MENLRKIALGLIAALVVLVVFDLLPSPLPSRMYGYQLFGFFYVWGAIYALLVMGIAAFAGAIVARVNFVGPAVSLALVTWIFSIYFLNSIAAAAGQAAFLDVAAMNGLSLVTTIVGAICGAILGRRYSQQNRNNVTNAA